jgi:hypothetical protein
MRLARVGVRALDGTWRRLPQQLPALRTLVVVAFKQRQQADVDRWIDLAVRLGVPPGPYPVDDGATAVIEVPVLGRRWLPARRLIDGGMAASIGDPVVLARTLTSYTDPTAFRRRCGIASADEVTAMVATRDGSVHFVASGPPAPWHDEGLRAALER